MKRYFIFGILTILIITFNFTFIIVLTSDKTFINYEFILLLWLGVILIAIGLAYLERKRRRTQEKSIRNSDSSSVKKSSSTTVLSQDATIFKNKTLQPYELQLIPDLTPKLEPGFFSGYIINEEYAYESVHAVYSREKQLLGFLGKNERLLCSNLQQLYKEPIVSWGNIVWNVKRNCFHLKAIVPILYSATEVNQLQQLINLKVALLELESCKTHFNPYSYLKTCEDFYFLWDTSEKPTFLAHDFDKNILYSYCKTLQQKQDWKEVLQINRFPTLIHQLPSSEKQEILSALKKAKKYENS